jgi:hypothetical protein
MKVQLFTLLVALVVYANLAYTPTVEDQAEPNPIDFVSLHSQAANALQSLQNAQESRAATQDMAAATF